MVSVSRLFDTCLSCLNVLRIVEPVSWAKSRFFELDQFGCHMGSRERLVRLSKRSHRG